MSSTQQQSQEQPSTNLQPVVGPSLWYGSEMNTQEKKKEWVYYFTEKDLEELEAAVKLVKENQTPLVQVKKENFSLPTLGPKLEKKQKEVVFGRGFVLFKGLPVHRYTVEETAITYWGIGCYFGDAVSQNKQGHLLGHVKDLGLDPKDPQTRIYTTRARQLFHTDSADIVGLLCLKTAKSGGLSTIVSSSTIYNTILLRNPKYAQILTEPFYWDRKNEIPSGKGPYFQLPIFNFHLGELSVIFSRDFIDAAQQRFPEIPRLSPEQIKALDSIQEISLEDGIRLDMTLEPGDIQFLHNHQILHARTEYVDHEDPDLKRHLLRLWLSAPNGRTLPPVFVERYSNIEAGTVRGGIKVPGAQLKTPLEAEL